MVIAYISVAYDRGPRYIGVLYSVSFPQKLKNLKYLAQFISAIRAQVGFLNDPDSANITSRSYNGGLNRGKIQQMQIVWAPALLIPAV